MSNIKEIYLTGIARDVCVFWSALDLLNYWILPAFKTGKVIKLVFMYDLTRPVSPVPGAPYTDKTPEQIATEAKALIAAMGLGPEVYDQVFEVHVDETLYNAAGGVRKTKTVKTVKTVKRVKAAKKKSNTRKTIKQRGG